MKTTRFLMMIVPALFFAGAFIGPMEQLASANDRSGRSRQGSVYRGGSGGGGGRAYGSPATAVRQRGDYVRSGSYSRGGDSVRSGSYRGGDYGRRGSYYRGAGSRHGGYYGRGYYGRGYYGGHGHHSDSHFSTSIWFGPTWGWSAWDPFYYPYPYYYRYPYYYGAPSTTVVIPQEPQQYIMKEPEQQGAEETGYWYYCREAKGYYPYVERCPGGWLKVVPREPPDADEE